MNWLTHLLSLNTIVALVALVLAGLIVHRRMQNPALAFTLGAAAAVIVLMFGPVRVGFGLAALALLAGVVFAMTRVHESSKARALFAPAAFITLVALAGTIFIAPSSSASDNFLAVAYGDSVEMVPISNTLSSEELEEVDDEDYLNSLEVTYFAYDAEPGTNNMGPAQTFNSAADGLGRMYEKVADPLWLATVTESAINGRNLDGADVERRASNLANDPAKHKEQARLFMENIEDISLVNLGDTPYVSLGMEVSGNDRSVTPKLTQFSNQVALGEALFVRFKNDGSMLLRAACDLQPSFTREVKNVDKPSQPEKAPTKPPTKWTPPTGGGNPPPPIGGDEPPPPTTKTTTSTPPPSTTTTTTTTTTTSEPPPSTSTTTTPPPDCPPESPDCKDEDAGADPDPNHPGAPDPTEPAESELPDEPDPIDPTVPEEDADPGAEAPGASNVPTEPREDVTPPEDDNTDLNTGGTDPDGNSGGSHEPIENDNSNSNSGGGNDAGSNIEGNGGIADAPSGGAEDALPAAPQNNEPAPADFGGGDVAADVAIEPMSYVSKANSEAKAAAMALLIASVVGALIWAHGFYRGRQTN